MPIEKQPWIDVQELLPRISIHEIAAYYRFDLGETFGSSGEQRTRCPVTACDGHNDFRSISINVSDVKEPWKCHRSGYGCGAQGDKLTLAHCMKVGAMPTGGKLTGSAFRAIAEDLQAIAGGSTPVPKAAAPAPRIEQQPPPLTIDDQPNVPLAESDNENARALVRLDEQFIVDPVAMPPEASKYMRSRDWLTPELCREARCGYLPSSAKGTLRGKWVYGVFADDGEPYCWVGRELKFEQKLKQWEASGRNGTEPAKYRFPSKPYFRRKFELFGQEQLNKPEYAETLKRLGLIIVEGFNDALRLRQLGVPAVAIMSNRVTAEQVKKIAAFAEGVGNGRINIMFDANTKGDEGAKEALWLLAQTGLNTKLVWSTAMFDARFNEKEPESITQDELTLIAANLG